jgi:predicted ATP-grasp superfamily ATP-dependent carboligase
VNEPLAIVGASTRAAAGSATRAGFRPIAADLFADVDLRAMATTTRISPYPEGLVDWLRALQPPAWMYTGALENHPELVDQMAWIAPLWGNAGDVLTRVRSPWELATALRGAGLLFPETRSSADKLPTDGTWLEKTYRGASGSGVRVWSEERGARSEETHDARPVCFQKRIAGTPCSAVFVAGHGAATLLGSTRQLIGEDWLGAHGFQYAGSIGPLPLSETVCNTLSQIGNVLAARFELAGLFGLDFILEGELVWTVEINPRYTASIEVVERATRIPVLALHAEACRGSNMLSVPPFPGEFITCGKAILFARRDIQISRPLSERWLQEALHLPWPTLADVPAADTAVQSGRPILTLFAEGINHHQVEEKLRRRVAAIEHEIYADP